MQIGITRPWFAEGFPLMCEDGKGPYGCDDAKFYRALRGYVPGLPRLFAELPEPPDTLVILDVLQFMYRHASAARVRDHHDFFGHDHLRFDRPAGQREIREETNSLLARNGLAYELAESGKIKHISAPVVRKLVRFALPPTSDAHLDRLLETARVKFTDRDPGVRREALDQAWDAFDRFKTMFDAADKKRGAEVLISRATSSEAEAQLIRNEMLMLAKIGNGFQIRHHEMDQAAIDLATAEYLFARMYALLHRLHPFVRKP